MVPKTLWPIFPEFLQDAAKQQNLKTEENLVIF